MRVRGELATNTRFFLCTRSETFALCIVKDMACTYRSPALRRLGQQLEVDDVVGTLTHGSADAVVAGVSSSNHDNVLPNHSRPSVE